MICALLLALGGQLPFLPEQPDPPKLVAPTDSSTVATNEKVYEAPPERALPDGEARALSGHIALVSFDGMVNPGMGRHVMEAIQAAPREGAQLVLVELDTPGGLVSTTQEIVKTMLASEVPVVVFVSPSGAHAASAGTFITLAAHVAAMAPATRIGAAHPVTGSGKDPEAEGGKHMARKIENDLLAMVEGVANERNRNVEWAKDAIRSSVSADAAKAEQIGVIDFVVRDRDALLERLDGMEIVFEGEKVALRTAGVEVREVEASMRNRLLNTLANPGVATILGTLGFLGIIVEIYSPGLIIPGVMGVLCILCSLVSLGQLPINLGGVLLVVAGLGLLVSELFTPSFGALGGLGAIALSFGLVLLVDLEDPNFALDPSFALSWWDVLPVALTALAFFAWLSMFVMKRKRAPAATGLESMVGALGKALRPVDGAGGQVFVGGEYWSARTQGDRVEPLRPVKVVAVEGMVLLVEEASVEAPVHE